MGSRIDRPHRETGMGSRIDIPHRETGIGSRIDSSHRVDGMGGRIEKGLLLVIDKEIQFLTDRAVLSINISFWNQKRTDTYHDIAQDWMVIL